MCTITGERSGSRIWGLASSLLFILPLLPSRCKRTPALRSAGTSPSPSPGWAAPRTVPRHTADYGPGPYHPNKSVAVRRSALLQGMRSRMAVPIFSAPPRGRVTRPWRGRGGRARRGVAQTVVITPPFPDQPPVHVIEVEEPLHLRARRLFNEPSVRPGLLIRQELHRHGADGIRQPITSCGRRLERAAGRAAARSTVGRAAGRSRRCCAHAAARLLVRRSG